MTNPGLEKFAAPVQMQRKVYPRRLFDEEDEGRGLHPSQVPSRVHEDPEEQGREDFSLRTSPLLPRREPGATLKNIDEAIVEHGIHDQPVSEAEERSADRVVAGEHMGSQPSTDRATETARQEVNSPEAREAATRVNSALSGGPAQSSPYISSRFRQFRVDRDNGMIQTQGHNGNRQIVQTPRRQGDPYVLHNNHGSFAIDDSNHLLSTLFAFQIISDINKQAADEQNWNNFPQPGQRRTSADKHIGYDDTCPACGYGYLVPQSAFMHECLNCGSVINVGELIAKEVSKMRSRRTAAPARRPGGLGPRKPLGDKPYDPDAPGEGRLDMFFADPDTRTEPDPDEEIAPHITTLRDEIVPIEGEHADDDEPYQAPGRGRLLGSAVNPGLARHAISIQHPIPPSEHTEALEKDGWQRLTSDRHSPVAYYKLEPSTGLGLTTQFKAGGGGGAWWTSAQHLSARGFPEPLQSPMLTVKRDDLLSEEGLPARLSPPGHEESWSPNNSVPRTTDLGTSRDHTGPLFIWKDINEHGLQAASLRRMNTATMPAFTPTTIPAETPQFPNHPKYSAWMEREEELAAMRAWRREHPGLQTTHIDSEGLLHYYDPEFESPMAVPDELQTDYGDDTTAATDQAMMKLKTTDPYAHGQDWVHPDDTIDHDIPLNYVSPPMRHRPSDRDEIPEGHRPVW